MLLLYHPTKFQADSWNPQRDRAVTSLTTGQMDGRTDGHMERWQLKYQSAPMAVGSKKYTFEKQYPVVLGLTHWGRVTHICVSNLTTIGSVNGLSPGRRQAITWTNAGILLIGPLETSFSEILIEIPTFSFKKMRLKVSSAKWRPFCLGLNVLMAAVAWRC